MIRGPALERLTFGDAALRYEVSLPRRWRTRRGAAALPLPSQEVPLAEVEAIRLEEEGALQGLFVDYCGKSLLIGACLREPEREWLAEVLRCWAEAKEEEEKSCPG